MSEQKTKTLPQGVLISGICKGVRTEHFNGRENYYIGFDVMSTDRYGQPTTATEEVSVFGDNAAALLDKARAAVGKHCVIQVLKRAMKSDRTGNAYMRTMINRSSQLLVIG